MDERSIPSSGPVSAKQLLDRLTQQLKAAEEAREAGKLTVRTASRSEDRDFVDARTEVLRLLALRLDMKVSRLRLDLPQLQLSAEDAAWLEEACGRLAADEPFAYVAGQTDFAGLVIHVGPGVLIPRPDSEVLVWQAARIIGQEARPGRPWTVLDLGTGSGALSLALHRAVSQAWPQLKLRILGTDLSPEALDWAKRNRQAQGLEEDFTLIACDLLPEPQLAARWQADMVLCNPPYVTRSGLRFLDASVRDHEPREAFDGGPDGLDYYRRLAVELGPWLRPGAHLLVEHSDRQQAEVEAIFKAESFTVEKRLQDLAGRPRALWLRFS
ncbi:MAG: peptide chain release factor N(5)-glutamine methyltransferase [Bacillota bacterium]|nr:peptide chain release factor N(5)-glutamine methyltransferase [Bacillota bacterium]